MADHRASQIIAAVVEKLKTTSADEVYRSTPRQVGKDTIACISVVTGPDDVEQVSTNTIDSWLTVYVDLHNFRGHTPDQAGEGVVGDYEQNLYTLRKEAHIKMMADVTHGLAFVIDTEPAGAQEVQLDGAGEHVSAVMRTQWRIKYRTSLTDPSQ